MERRRFLRLGGGALGVAALASGTGTARQGERTDAEDSFEPLGSVDVPGATDAAVHHDNQFAFVAADDGFGVVDISSPAAPELVAERRAIEAPDGRVLDRIFDVWPWEDRLVVGGPAFPGQSPVNAFALFDISDPTDPNQVAFQETGRQYIHNTYFEDGIVYLTGSGLPKQPLVMYDVAEDDPVEVGRWSIIDHDPGYQEVPITLRTIHDMYVQNGIAYLAQWDAGTWIVDVSDPAEPEVVSRISEYDLEELQEFDRQSGAIESLIPPGNSHYTQVNEDGTILVVGREAWEVQRDGERQGGPGGVDLYDIREKTDPAHLAHIDAPDSFDSSRDGWFTTAHNADIVGERLYTSWYFGGVKVHDISDPTEPEMAWWRDPRQASFWTAQSAGDVFVASSADLSDKISEELNETREALYVFPDRPGEQHDPPSLTDRPTDIFGPENGSSTDGDSSNGDSESNDDGDSNTDGDYSGDGDDEETSTNDTEDESPADSVGPGFGVAGALASLGGVSYLLARRSSESDE